VIESVERCGSPTVELVPARFFAGRSAARLRASSVSGGTRPSGGSRIRAVRRPGVMWPAFAPEFVVSAVDVGSATAGAPVAVRAVQLSLLEFGCFRGGQKRLAFVFGAFKRRERGVVPDALQVGDAVGSSRRGPGVARFHRRSALPEGNGDGKSGQPDLAMTYGGFPHRSRFSRGRLAVSTDRSAEQFRKAIRVAPQAPEVLRQRQPVPWLVRSLEWPAPVWRGRKYSPDYEPQRHSENNQKRCAKNPPQRRLLPLDSPIRAAIQ
jgi:hypothetical protein